MFKAAFSGFSVDSIEKARSFYVDMLECKVLDDSMGLFMKLPGGAHAFAYEKSDHKPATFTILNFEAEDIDKAVDELSGKGVGFEQYDWGNEAKTDDKGIMRSPSPELGPTIAWFKDPAGNTLAVLQR